MFPKAAPGAGLALLLLVAGCGQGDDSKAVGIRVSAPTNDVVVHDDAIEVRGRVQPADARVLVLGRRATVSRGRFSARVPLRQGSNVIDVGASADGAVTSWTAVRVSRVVVVEVPDLAGSSRGDAVDRLESLGLRAQVDESEGFLDRFLPGDPSVCETKPDAGTELPKGSRVRLTVSKTC
jgi:hypothetical protein